MGIEKAAECFAGIEVVECASPYDNAEITEAFWDGRYGPREDIEAILQEAGGWTPACFCRANGPPAGSQRPGAAAGVNLVVPDFSILAREDRCSPRSRPISVRVDRSQATRKRLTIITGRGDLAADCGPQGFWMLRTKGGQSAAWRVKLQLAKRQDQDMRIWRYSGSARLRGAFVQAFLERFERKPLSNSSTFMLPFMVRRLCFKPSASKSPIAVLRLQNRQ